MPAENRPPFRGIISWRLATLSNGEHSSSSMMRRALKPAPYLLGPVVRMVLKVTRHPQWTSGGARSSILMMKRDAKLVQRQRAEICRLMRKPIKQFQLAGADVQMIPSFAPRFLQRAPSEHAPRRGDLDRSGALNAFSSCCHTHTPAPSLRPPGH